jgi:YHS domain-containing protein
MLRFTRVHAIVALAALAVPLSAVALDPVHQNWRGIAVDGTDVVAYFQDGRPVASEAAYSFDWNGATWRFASAENRERFRAEPERFVPQYGGYCAWAVGHGYTASTDPEAWSIVEGKLYLNYSRDVQAMWEPEKAQWIERANAEWPRLRDAR